MSERKSIQSIFFKRARKVSACDCVTANAQEVYEYVQAAALCTVVGSDSNLPVDFVPLKVLGRAVVSNVSGKPWLVRWHEPIYPPPEFKLGE